MDSLLFKYRKRPLAVDVQADNIRIITAYHPTVENWEDDFKMRRGIARPLPIPIM
jgi:hypothetical protein